MEYNLSKQSISFCDKFLDTVNEQIVDADVSLPDYCPDIEKILKCTLIPKIYTRNISGGQLTIDGVSVIRILYCDSIRHNVRCYEHTTPFSATFNLKTTPQQYIVLANAKCEYINCRALSPRKLVIHGAFSLYAKVLSKSMYEVYDFEEECDLQTKKRTLQVSDMCSLFQEQFSLSQDIAVNKTFESVLSYDVNASIIDLKSISNKLMLSGELKLSVLYLSDLDSGEVDHLTYTFEINKIFDCDGVLDDTVNVPVLEVMSCDLSVRNDTLSNTSLNLDAKLCLSSVSYADKNLSVLEDVYSTKYSTEAKRSTLCFENKHRCVDVSHIAKSTFKLDGTKISKMLDVYCESINLSPILSDEKLSFSGKANICMLMEDDSNAPFYIERSVEIEFSPEIQDMFDRVTLNSCLAKSISFRLADEESVEVRLEVVASVLLCNAESLNPVVSVTADEDSYESQQDCSLVMYFADKGEDVWDIAKAYKTKKSLLLSENMLENDVLENSRMLLVVTE